MKSGDDYIRQKHTELPTAVFWNSQSWIRRFCEIHIFQNYTFHWHSFMKIFIKIEKL